MARTKAEIYQQLVTAKDNRDSLNGLTPENDNAQQLLNEINSGSKVAFWRLMFSVVSEVIFTLETLWDAFRNEIIDRVDRGKIHSFLWYRDMFLKYQHGHSLEYIDGSFKYETIDTSLQVVKQVAVQNIGGVLRVKVAGMDENGTLQPIFPDELTGLQEYYAPNIKDAGTNILVTSDQPDELLLELQVYYNPAVLNQDGTLINDENVSPVVDAINEYLASLDFNGVFVPTILIDSIQKAEGVKNPILHSSKVKDIASGTFIDTSDYYSTQAGYMILTPDTPISNQITYIPRG